MFNQLRKLLSSKIEHDISISNRYHSRRHWSTLIMSNVWDVFQDKLTWLELEVFEKLKLRLRLKLKSKLK
jgi:hypothetical protein